jgi:DsbC/DsbD-like thiol-disulfide interchange protein
MNRHRRTRALLSGLALLAMVLAAGRVGLAQSGAWVSGDHSAVRLVGAGENGGTWSAGLEITLGDGWKTYWRMPGESGVPPEFDWSNSTNVAAVAVDWPAPSRLHDASSETIGYKGHVVLPLTVTLGDQAKPARLALKLFYAVCKDICVPASAELSLDLDGAADEADAALVRHYQSLVPVEDAAGAGLLSATAREENGKPVLAVLTSANLVNAGGDADIFVEGFDSAYFRAPRAGAEGPAGREYLLAVDGIATAGELIGKTLLITWVSDRQRLYRRLRVE